MNKLTETLFECRCCGNATRGFTDGSFKGIGWNRLEGIDGPNAICPRCSRVPEAIDFFKEEYPNVHVVPGTSVLIPAADGKGGIVWFLSEQNQA